MNRNIKTEFLIDKFTDYALREREFILAAVSVPLRCDEELYIPDITSYQEDYGTCYYEEDVAVPMKKYLLLGIAIKHPDDKFDDKIGKRIAVGKALKMKGKQLIASDPGLINTKMVRALLEQEAGYFKRNPEAYIAGYKKAAEKWIKEQLVLQS